ncbi:MAG: hypothetical protein ABIR54_00975 [Burkholderiaceae bacterium]
MAQISVQVKNRTSDNQIVRVYDQFAGGRREVSNSPFALASDETSPAFGVNADAHGDGVISYACDGGPSLSNVDVVDSTVVEVS